MKVLYLPIDLLKAEQAPHTHYAMRLMVAVNDLIACRNLDLLVPSKEKRSSWEVNIDNNSRLYLLRVQSSHLVESYEGLVKPVRSPDQCSGAKARGVQEFVYSDDKVKSAFENACQFLDCDKFKLMKKVRDKMGFHYDQHGRIYGQALKQYSKELAERDERQVGYIQASFDEFRSRWLNLLAVESLQSLYRRLLGDIPDLIDHSEDQKTLEVRDFEIRLGTAFIEYADSFLLKWIDENGLKGQEKVIEEDS